MANTASGMSIHFSATTHRLTSQTKIANAALRQTARAFLDVGAMMKQVDDTQARLLQTNKDAALSDEQLAIAKRKVELATEKALDKLRKEEALLAKLKKDRMDPGHVERQEKQNRLAEMGRQISASLLPHEKKLTQEYNRQRAALQALIRSYEKRGRTGKANKLRGQLGDLDDRFQENLGASEREQLNALRQRGERIAESLETDEERLKRTYREQSAAIQQLIVEEKLLGNTRAVNRLKASQARLDAGFKGGNSKSDFGDVDAMRKSVQQIATAQLTGSRRVVQSYRQQKKEIDDLIKAERAAGNSTARLTRLKRQLRASTLQLVQAERQRRRNEGLTFMRQFETSQQRLNRQIEEANRLHKKGAITTKEHAMALKTFRYNASVAGMAARGLGAAMSSILGPIAVAMAAWEAFRSVIRTTSEFQQARAKMEVFTGSVARANEVMKELRAFAAESPISFAGAQRAATTLMQYGVVTAEAVELTRRLGEASGGNTERMENMALAMAQVRAAGRLMGQENIQLLNSGLSPLLLISQKTGESMAELKARMEDGLISWEEVRDVVMEATEEGGRFNGMLDNIAETLAGRLAKAASKIQEASIIVGEFLDLLGSGVIENFTNELAAGVDVMNRLLAATQAVDDAAKKATASLLEMSLGYEGDTPGSPSMSFTGAINSMMGMAEYVAMRAQGEDVFSDRMRELERSLSRDTNGWFDVGSHVTGRKQAVAEYEDAFSRIEEIRQRFAEGQPLAEMEEKALESYNKRLRETKEISDAVFLAREKHFQQQMKGAENESARMRTMIAFVESVGQGHFDDNFIASYEEAKKKVDEIEAAEERRLAIQKQIEKSIQKQTDKMQEQINSLRFDEQGLEKARALISMLDADGQSQAQGLLNNATSTADFFQQFNNSNIPRSQEQIDAFNEFQKRQLELAKLQRQDKADKTLDKLQQEMEYRLRINTLGKEEADIRKRMADDGLTRQEAEKAMLLEQQAEAFKKQYDEAEKIKQNQKELIADLKEELTARQKILDLGQTEARKQDLIGQGFTGGKSKEIIAAEKQSEMMERLIGVADSARGSDENNKMVQELSDLKTLLNLGRITQEQYDRVSVELLAKISKSAEQTAIAGATTPEAVQAGSSSALSRVADQQIETLKAQLMQRDRDYRLNKANKEANVRSANTLQELNRNRVGAL